MSDIEHLKQKIAEAINKFEKLQMGVKPERTEVSIHSDSITVTLTGIISQAEKNCADNRKIWELMQKFYHAVFRVIKPVIESEIGQIVGANVNATTISVSPEAGKGVMLFTFEKNTFSPKS